MRKLIPLLAAAFTSAAVSATAANIEVSFGDAPFSTAPFSFVADGQGMLRAGSFLVHQDGTSIATFNVSTTAGTRLGGFDYPYAAIDGVTLFGSTPGPAADAVAPGARLLVFFFPSSDPTSSFRAAEMACPAGNPESCILLPLRQGTDITVQLGDAQRDVIEGATRWASVSLTALPVSEPGSMMLLGAALLGFGAIRHSRG